MSNGYLRTNPTDACVLPRVEKKQIKPLDEDQITAFLKEIRGHQFEYLFVVTLFAGMRESEALGLTWDCVNFENSTITISSFRWCVEVMENTGLLPPRIVNAGPFP